MIDKVTCDSINECIARLHGLGASIRHTRVCKN
jgi:hypothetical protein